MIASISPHKCNKRSLNIGCIVCRVFLLCSFYLLPHSTTCTAFAMMNISNDKSYSYDEENKDDTGNDDLAAASSVDGHRGGRLKKVKDREAELLRQLSFVREEKRDMLRSKPLTIGVVGFGRFGQFIARSFSKHASGHNVVATSRSDYTAIAAGMGATYVPLSDPASFVGMDLDVIVLAVSILSFENTVKTLKPHLERYIEKKQEQEPGGRTVTGPLIVDVLSVKEHPREILLDQLPPQCDILCTHPMFGPESGKYSWEGLNFVFERTRINGVVYEPNTGSATVQSPPPQSPLPSGYVEGLERMERFLSIWEEEGCRMVPMSCQDHDEFAANSQFITHLMGRILGAQGLQPTPIDTKGFESVLELVGTTTTDSFDLFYGLYKYNRNSMETIQNLRNSMNDVVEKLMEMEKDEKDPTWMNGSIPRKLSLQNLKTNSNPLTAHSIAQQSTTSSTPAEPAISETLLQLAVESPPQF